MNAIIAGSASGLLFSSLLITVGSFILFFLFRNGHPSVVSYFTDLTSTRVILTIILALNPLCAVTGVLFALAFTVLHKGLPQYNGLANNGVYFGIVAVLSLLLFAQTLILVKTLHRYYQALGACFLLIFGILIPLLLSR